jgi:hypothetical protein
MAAAKVKCPDCGLALNPAKAPQPGKKVKCPRCANVFTVPGPDEIQTVPPRPAAKKPNPAIQKAAPAKATGKAPAPGKPPAPKPGPAAQDEEAGVYGFKTSPDEEKKQEEEKPEIEYAPDLSVKDPRGPATAILVKPTNFMLLLGSLGFFWGTFCFGAGIWPFIFSEYLIEPKMMDPYLTNLQDLTRKLESEKDPDKKKLIQKGIDGIGNVTLEQLYKNEKFLNEVTVEKLKEKSPALYDAWERLCDDRQSDLILKIVIGLLEMIFGGALAFSAVRLQNIDSLTWAWTAVGLSIVVSAAFGGYYLAQILGQEGEMGVLDYPLMLLWFARIAGGIFLGVIVIGLLKDEKIKAAFDYNPE